MLPESLRALLADAASIIAVVDGPLSGIPIDCCCQKLRSRTPHRSDRLAHGWMRFTLKQTPRLDHRCNRKLVEQHNAVIVSDPV